MTKNNIQKYLKLRAKFYRFEPMDDTEILELGELSKKVDRIADKQSEKVKRYRSYRFKKKS